MVRRLGLGKNNHLSYASLALNPRNVITRHLPLVMKREDFAQDSSFIPLQRWEVQTLNLWEEFSKTGRIGYNWAAMSENVLTYVLLAQIQISLHICAVWKKSSRGVFWMSKDAKSLHADSKYSYLPAQMRRPIRVFLDAHFICEW